jgi:hypothetical protein
MSADHMPVMPVDRESEPPAPRVKVRSFFVFDVELPMA